MRDHDIALDPALVSLLREKNVLTQKPKEKEKDKEKEKEKEKEKPRDWVFVDETSSVVFSFDGDYEKEITTKLILLNKTPPPLKGQKYSREHVIYPAHVMGNTISSRHQGFAYLILKTSFLLSDSNCLQENGGNEHVR